MVSAEHEVMARHFDFQVLTKAANMGVRLNSYGSTRVEQGSYIKDPDCSFKPPPVNRRTWPTFVVEVGWSETANKLAVDAEGWLEAEGSETQLVVTIKIERNSPKIIIQRWEKTGSRVITRNNRASSEPTQQVEISYDNGRTTVSAPLQLPFEKVFDRSKNPNNPLHRDMIFSCEDLIDLAEREWETHGIANF
ncbi:hypothetical protein FQN54_001441 [Arachnomyces sp. PD_36]|nr:hypothetical protein FQN54_001441 [Arachnomyces sp. PD_36]